MSRHNGPALGLATNSGYAAWRCECRAAGMRAPERAYRDRQTDLRFVRHTDHNVTTTLLKSCDIERRLPGSLHLNLCDLTATWKARQGFCGSNSWARSPRRKAASQMRSRQRSTASYRRSSFPKESISAPSTYRSIRTMLSMISCRRSLSRFDYHEIAGGAAIPAQSARGFSGIPRIPPRDWASGSCFLNPYPLGGRL